MRQKSQDNPVNEQQTPDQSDTGQDLSSQQHAGTAADVEYMPLKVFADQYALKYGVELMAGFYHEQEKNKNFAEPESVWHEKMAEFSKKEVK